MTTPDSTPASVDSVMALSDDLAKAAFKNGKETYRHGDAVVAARAALGAEVERLAQSAPTDDAMWDQTLQERDTYHDWADKLAEGIAAHLGVDIGEHTAGAGANNPWANALEAIQAVAQSAPLAQQAREYPPLPKLPTMTVLSELQSGTQEMVRLDVAHEAMRAYVDADRAAAQVEPKVDAVRMLTEDEPEKCYSLDEETFHEFGDFMDMLDEDQCKPGFLVFEGDSVRHTASHYARGAVADMFERMGEEAFDEAGEHIGDWPDHAVKGGRLDELEKLIFDWLDANVKVHFFTVKNVKQIALTAEMIGDDSGVIPADGEVRPTQEQGQDAAPAEQPQDDEPTWQELEDFRKRHWTHWNAADNLLIAHLAQKLKCAARPAAQPGAQEPAK